MVPVAFSEEGLCVPTLRRTEKSVAPAPCLSVRAQLTIEPLIRQTSKQQLCSEHMLMLILMSRP